ncbi:hypothetical protein WJX81_007556 [Elliptochloris bilobata]|uniref:Brix domain-containing protein n=1 Tax=Elliptochloris bilobata TaxID=381761 RepID=A0AAW1R2A3_9CHLO
MATIGQLTSHIANKQVRNEKYAQLKHKQKKDQKKERIKRQREAAAAESQGLAPPPRKVQKTLENTRAWDETRIQPDDAENAADIAEDEFASYFNRQETPKVLLTTCYKPSKLMFELLAELLDVLPVAYYYKRQGYSVKKVAEYASNRGFTNLIVLNENRKEVNGLLLVHLPHGPTAQFRLSNLKLARDIKGHARATHHKPEVIMNNFDTVIGQRVGRLLASLFSQDSAFKGRQVATFHNQRDFIFFRHHRYLFEEKKGKLAAKEPVGARLQEIGPRFTLRLRSLQAGVFDKAGEVEWKKKASLKATRREFAL